MEKFKFLKHTADVKFQAFGKTLEEIFKNSVLAMSKVISDDKINEKVKKKIKIKGKDNENLLYNLLEEILFLFDSKNLIISKAGNLKIKNKELSAELSGDYAKNYKINMDIKAVTYNEMFIKKTKDKWIAQVVLDV
ncbi:hypothetical protein DRN73_06175 [Candidatus Pacearchaeota archaeon]|nr:MAG: hypothetical protein DRN73_06175 [Candidatus Pacearchaeota archaeon]